MSNEYVLLKTYLLEIEEEFDVKFSYVDSDLNSLQIRVPIDGNLQGILTAIKDQTQLEIKKLSDRYYSLTKNSTISICGFVLDNFSQKTTSAASIEVLNSNISTLTDENGQFFLNEIPRESTLRIRYLGFKTKYIAAESLVDKNPCSTILLSLKYQQLEEVIVYKFLTTGLAKEQDGSISLNTEEFGIIPGLIEPDVLQTIQALPGIKSIDERVSDINIRGGTNDQNLILWDNIKMYQSGHFFWPHLGL